MSKSLKIKLYIAALVVIFFVLSFFSKYKVISKNDIVSGMSIDLKNNVYTVVCEVSMPSSDNDFGSEAEYVKGSGFTLKDALYNASLKSANCLYFESVQLYLVSRDAFSEKDVKEFFISEFVNYRAVAIGCEGEASKVLYNESDSQSRAKSLSLSQKIKKFCNDQHLNRPGVITFIKTGGEVFINRDGLMQKGGKI